LRNAELRQKYLGEMLDIVCCVDVGYVPHSHQIWIDKNDPDLQQDQKANESPEPGMDPNVPLQLDGGVTIDHIA
jgi:hypothetical protein